MEVKHGTCKKVRWEAYKGHKIFLSMVRAMRGVQLKDRKGSMDISYIDVGLNETIDQLAMANNVCWHGHLLRREDGLILRRVLDFEVESQWKKGRPKRIWMKQVEEVSVKVVLRREEALC